MNAVLYECSVHVKCTVYNFQVAGAAESSKSLNQFDPKNIQIESVETGVERSHLKEVVSGMKVQWKCSLE